MGSSEYVLVAKASFADHVPIYRASYSMIDLVKMKHSASSLFVEMFERPLMAIWIFTLFSELFPFETTYTMCA